MRSRAVSRPSSRTQAGFSMIELLMTAFVLAVGILGLTMLQVMSIRAARGSQGLSTAVLVGEQVMDRVEMEGRLSWLNATSGYVTPNALSELQYIGKGTVTQTFNIKGQKPTTASSDPADVSPYFTVRTTQANTAAAGTGQTTDVTVTVSFTEAVNPQTKVPIVRTFTLTRRVLHG